MAKCKGCNSKNVSWVKTDMGKWKLVDGKFKSGSQYNPETQAPHYMTCTEAQRKREEDRQRQANLTPFQKATSEKQKLIRELQRLEKSLIEMGATEKTVAQFMNKKKNTVAEVYANPKLMTPQSLKKAIRLLMEQEKTLRKVKGL